MKKIYIAGKVSGEQIHAVTMKFGYAQKEIEGAGFEAVNPLEVVNDWHASWPEAMKKCIKALVDCDGLFLLDDHDSSRGAMMEKSIAVSLCIPVYSRIADLRLGVGD